MIDFTAAALNAGVILIRYPVSARSRLTADVLRLLDERTDSLYGCFAVAELGRIRSTAAMRQGKAPAHWEVEQMVESIRAQLQRSRNR